MVVAVVVGQIDLLGDVVGEPGRGGFDITGGPVLTGGYYGSDLDNVVVPDRGSGGFFDDLITVIDATTAPMPPDMTDIADVLTGGGTILDDFDPPDDDGGGFFDDIWDAVATPTYDPPPYVLEDGWVDDVLPVITAPDADGLDLDLEMGTVMSPDLDDSPVGDYLEIPDLDHDVMLGDPIAPLDVDDSADDFDMPDLEMTDIGGAMEMPEIELSEPTDFEQAIQATDDLESSLDDLFGDID